LKLHNDAEAAFARAKELEYQEWKNAAVAAATTTDDTATAKSQKKQPGFEDIIAVAGLLAITYLKMTEESTPC
jgi:hypothetical protein